MASNRKLSTAGSGRARDKGDASKRTAKVAAHFFLECRGGGRGITRRRIAYFFSRAAILGGSLVKKPGFFGEGAFVPQSQWLRWRGFDGSLRFASSEITACK
jgi:hypothetical protein